LIKIMAAEQEVSQSPQNNSVNETDKHPEQAAAAISDRSKLASAAVSDTKSYVAQSTLPRLNGNMIFLSYLIT